MVKHGHVDALRLVNWQDWRMAQNWSSLLLLPLIAHPLLGLQVDHLHRVWHYQMSRRKTLQGKLQNLSLNLLQFHRDHKLLEVNST